MKRLPLLAPLLLAVLSWSAASPARAGVSLIGEALRFYEISTGQTAEGTLTVQNDGKEPQTVKVNPGDYVATEGGKGRYEKPGVSPRSNAGWISLSPQSVTILPGERGYINYKITPPPETKDFTGLYWSSLLVEPDTPAMIQRDEEAGVTVKTMIRYSVKILTQLNSPGAADMAFVERELRRSEKGISLLLKVQNKGERLLKPAATLELFGASGEKLGLFKAQALQLLPGFSGAYEFHFGKLAVGAYRALIVADNGDDAVFAGEYELQVSAP